MPAPLLGSQSASLSSRLISSASSEAWKGSEASKSGSRESEAGNYGSSPSGESGPLQSGWGLHPLVASGHPAFTSQSARPGTGDIWI